MDLVLVNAKFLNLATGLYEQGKSILITGEYIRHIGQMSECIALAKTTPEILDLRGKIIVPAFVDTHTHFVEYAKRKIMVDLSACERVESVLAVLQSYRSNQISLPPWILGGGWDKNKLDQPDALNKELVDKVFPDIPVALWSKDYHGKLCNSMALKLAGIDSSTPDPAGGKIVRDGAGVPTGLLYEAAAELLEHHIVQPDRDLIKQAVLAAVSDARRFGLVGVHTMEGAASWSVLEELRHEGLNFRFTWHFQLDELNFMLENGIRSYSGDEWLKIGGLKIFADGALGSQTAAMFNPYTGTSNCGILRYTDDALWRIGEQAAARGIALTIHGIGDRAVNQILRLFKDLQAYPGLLHRIEHAQCVRREDLTLLRDSGAACALQPVHLANDVDMIENHWQGVRGQAYNFADLLRYSSALGFGSDAPIESLNPCLGIYSAIARKPKLDSNQPGWRLDQSLGLTQALDAYTLGAAKLSQSSHIRGKIETNYYADLIVFEDYLEQEQEYWLEASPELVICAGEIVEITRQF